MKEHYSNKGGHLERSLYNKILKKTPQTISRGEIKIVVKKNYVHNIQKI